MVFRLDGCLWLHTNKLLYEEIGNIIAEIFYPLKKQNLKPWFRAEGNESETKRFMFERIRN